MLGEVGRRVTSPFFIINFYRRWARKDVRMLVSKLHLMQEIKKLFPGKDLSVRKFTKTLSDFPPEKQQYYYSKAYTNTLFKWETLSQRNKTFLVNLVNHDPDNYIKFIRDTTILGQLQYTLKNQEEFIKLLNLTEANEKNVKCSFSHLAFSLLLSFNINLKTSSLRKYLRTATFTPEELLELNGRATIDPGQQPYSK